jgi:hypothetical protein
MEPIIYSLLRLQEGMYSCKSLVIPEEARAQPTNREDDGETEVIKSLVILSARCQVNISGRRTGIYV